MTEAERIDLIRDLENTCDRVREMYPDAMSAPRPLRRLFNRLVPRAITALRDANAKSTLLAIATVALKEIRFACREDIYEGQPEWTVRAGYVDAGRIARTTLKTLEEKPYDPLPFRAR